MIRGKSPCFSPLYLVQHLLLKMCIYAVYIFLLLFTFILFYSYSYFCSYFYSSFYSYFLFEMENISAIYLPQWMLTSTSSLTHRSDMQVTCSVWGDIWIFCLPWRVVVAPSENCVVSGWCSSWCFFSVQCHWQSICTYKLQSTCRGKL